MKRLQFPMFMALASGLLLLGSGLMLSVGSARNAQAQESVQGENWTCSLDNIGATLTRCSITPYITSDRALYITDIVGQSTTGTAGQFLLQYGTGTNCGTGTTSLLPSAASAVRIGYPANTAAPVVLQFLTPLKVPAGKDLCLLGIATQTFSGQISGYARP